MTQIIVNYKIVSGNDLIDLEMRVYKHIEEDWQPFGNVNQIKTGPRNYYAIQVMVKYEKSKDQY